MHAKAIWSIHDVSPGSFEKALHIVETMEAADIAPLCILIVPDGTWTDAQTDALRAWEGAGHLLGLHGWSHRGARPRTLYHRIHATVLSRGAAEHLGLGAPRITELIERGLGWFRDAGLAAPRLYVPPAWAMGSLRRETLETMPFRWVETLTGIYEVRTRRFQHLPLAGFEADTTFRSVALRVSNGVNGGLARLSGRPLRVAVHPDDFDLRLAPDLTRWLRLGVCSVGPGDL